MRRLGHALFFTAAFAACLWAVKARAEEKKPVEIRALAVCEKGRCVMDEKDYKALKAFMAETIKVTKQNDEIEEKVTNDLQDLMSALEACKSRRRQWITKE